MRTSIVAACCAALAVGCGGDSGVDVDTNESNVCAEIAEVACHNLYSCCTEGEIEDFLGVGEPRSELQCREDVRRVCERQTASLDFSIKEGRVRFEPEVMNTCLDSLVAPDGTCAEVLTELPWTEACMNSAWIGTVGTDGACFFSYECAGSPDAFCAPNQKCQARPGHGQPCGSGCASDFYCATNNICQPRLPAGAVCQGSDECQNELFCDFTQTMPVCTAPAGGGSPCTSHASCESGQCIPGMCAGTTVGETCLNDLDCSGRCADDGSFCSEPSQCAIGSCSGSGLSCTSETQCASTEDCIFPVQCVPGDCIGDPVCTAPRFTVDYCEDALQQLPGV